MAQKNPPAKKLSPADLAVRDHYEILLGLCRSQVAGNSVQFLKKRMDKFFEAEHAQWFLSRLASSGIELKTGQLIDSDSQSSDLPKDTLFSFEELIELFELYTRIYPSEKKLIQLEIGWQYLGLNQDTDKVTVRHELQATLNLKSMEREEREEYRQKEPERLVKQEELRAEQMKQRAEQRERDKKYEPFSQLLAWVVLGGVGVIALGILITIINYSPNNYPGDDIYDVYPTSAPLGPEKYR